jgi:hypothetical protein
METKPTYKTEIALAVSLLMAVLPVILDALPPDSKWIPLVGGLLALVTYMGSRQYRVASDNKSAALVEASKQVPPSSPPQP